MYRISKRCIITFILIVFSFYTNGQSRIIVKDNFSGKTEKLKKGKLIGLITTDNDTIKHTDQDAYPDNSYWYLKSFTDSSLSIEFKRTSEIKTFNFNKIRTLSFKRNESTGSPVALAVGGLALVIASPFVGIEKDGYNFGNAGLTLGIGAGLVAIVYLTARNKDLRDYTIVGTITNR